MVSDKVELIIQQHNQKQLSQKETAGHESQERKTESQQGETIQQHPGQSAQKGGGWKLTWGWQSPVPSHGGGPWECCDLRTCSLDGDRGLRHCLNCRQLLVLVAGLTVLGSAPGSSGSSSDPGCRREKLTLGQGISSTQETNAVERAVWLLNCRPVAQSIALRSSRNSAGGSE